MYDTLWHYAALLLGILCAGLGGECFIRGTVGLAHWARVSTGIIGTTVAAFATSSPELTVALTAAVSGAPALSLGDALGSNVLNIALVLGLALLMGDLRCQRREIARDWPVALGVPVALGLVALDGTISRLEGGVLLAIFLTWITVVTIEAARQRSASEEVLGEKSGGRAILYSVFGLALLIAAGRLIVSGAGAIAQGWGLDPFVIGAVIVAVGTSVPELATTIIARHRGHDEVGVGTLLGSNIFNGLFIIGLVAVIHPIPVTWRAVALALGFGVVTLLFTYPSRRGFLSRWRGVWLLALYGVYVLCTLRG